MRRVHGIVCAGMMFIGGCGAPEALPPESAVVEDNVDPMSVRPFEIAVSDELLIDLDERLARTRFPEQIGESWVYGTDRAYLQELVSYWLNEYDWREQERHLNTFDHYKTEIEGLDIHFIHQRSPEPDALPIIITHGWPGSVVEFLKIIGPLTDPVAYGGQAEDAFHVIAPSMPGFGFSGKPTEPGVGPEQIADIHAQLMERLGYARYGAQGGDWGAGVSRWMAYNYPEQVVGLHLNMVLAGPPADSDDPTGGATAEELERMQARRAVLADGFAYSQIQGTRPQASGYGLDDSPAGLAGWIVEKLQRWWDCNGDPESVFTKDELLTNIMFYWVTQSATSAARLYYESSHQSTGGLITTPPGRVEVPTAGAIFPKDLSLTPRRWAEAHYNITHWTEMPYGGHFAAFEQPDLLVEDLRSFYGAVR